LQGNGVRIDRQGLRGAAAAIAAIVLAAGTAGACSGYTADAAPSERAGPTSETPESAAPAAGDRLVRARDDEPVGTQGPPVQTVDAITTSGLPPLPPMGTLVPPGASTRAARNAPAGARRGVAVFGDSLVLQSWAYLQRIARDRNQPFTGGAYGGTALCDWSTGIDTALHRDRPAAMVLAFAGNNLTPCTRTPGGDRRFGAALVQRYRADVERAVAEAERVGTTVYLVGPAAMRDARWNDHARRLRRMLRAVADRHDQVEYLDARAVLSSDGFAIAGRCRSFETAALGCRRGTIAVRDADGVHLSPPVGGAGGYSAGAWRFATLLLRGVRNAA
jgi:hypothetical protein